MHIYATAETPQGVPATVHRIHNLVVSGENVEITINSFMNEAGATPVWQDVYPMPYGDFATGSYPFNVLDYLTGNAGPFIGGQIIHDPSSFEGLKAKTLKRINELRFANAHGGCDTPFGVMDTTEISIRNIMAAVTMASLAISQSQPYSVVWRSLDNTEVTLDALGMISVGMAVNHHIDRAYRLSWELKAAVEAATSIEELEAMVLGGWSTDMPLDDTPADEGE